MTLARRAPSASRRRLTLYIHTVRGIGRRKLREALNVHQVAGSEHIGKEFLTCTLWQFEDKAYLCDFITYEAESDIDNLAGWMTCE